MTKPRPKSVMIDPVQFGRLTASVEHLTEELDRATDLIEKLNSRLNTMEDRLKFGKGAVAGILLAIVCSLYGLKELVSDALGWLGKP